MAPTCLRPHRSADRYKPEDILRLAPLAGFSPAIRAAYRKSRVFVLIEAICRSGMTISRGLGAPGGKPPRIEARTAVVELVAAAVRQRERDVSIANARQRVRQIGQPMSDEMDDLARALDAAVDRHHPCRKDHPALPFIKLRPDHEIGDAGLVLDGDEHDAFRR